MHGILAQTMEGPLSIQSLGSIGGIVLLTLAILQSGKKWLSDHPVFGKIPVCVYLLAISLGLTLLANKVLKILPGDLKNLLASAAMGALASSGVFTWGKEGIKPIETTKVLIGLLMIPMFFLGGCVDKSAAVREGLVAASAEPHREYLQWTDEKVAAHLLTANDGKIRHDSIKAFDALVDQSRASDGRLSTTRP